MNVKKFYADNAREALRQVRDDLGADAIILSNRQVGGRIEIMAAAASEISFVTAANTPERPVAATRARPEGRPATARPETIANPRGIAADLPFMLEEPEAPQGDNLSEVEQEIKFLRGMLEGQLAGFAWGQQAKREPVKAELMRRMLSAGFSPALSRQLLERMPAGHDYERGLPWLKTTLIDNLRAVASGNDIVERGGVYALVGPTGVGKTTTVAKLAARCTLKYGVNRLALISADSFRIGAYEQLRIYGKILGVAVYTVTDEMSLQQTLSDLRDKHLVLIDTVGMSQRDRRVAEQSQFLCGSSQNVRRLLLLSANAQGGTLDDVLRAYQGDGLDGCILTKIDEAINVGAALDVIIRHRLLLHYVTNGQRVPEDMHLPNPMYLIDRAFKSPHEGSPFTLSEEDYPLVAAGGGKLEAGAHRG